MYRYDREWTDPRDGRTWTITGMWPSLETLMGRLRFQSRTVSFDTWLVSNHGVDHISDRDIEGMIDWGRQRQQEHSEPAGMLT